MLTITADQAIGPLVLPVEVTKASALTLQSNSKWVIGSGQSTTFLINNNSDHIFKNIVVTLSATSKSDAINIPTVFDHCSEKDLMAKQSCQFTVQASNIAQTGSVDILVNSNGNQVSTHNLNIIRPSIDVEEINNQLHNAYKLNQNTSFLKIPPGATRTLKIENKSPIDILKANLTLPAIDGISIDTQSTCDTTEFTLFADSSCLIILKSSLDNKIGSGHLNISAENADEAELAINRVTSSDSLHMGWSTQAYVSDLSLYPGGKNKAEFTLKARNTSSSNLDDLITYYNNQETLPNGFIKDTGNNCVKTLNAQSYCNHSLTYDSSIAAPLSVPKKEENYYVTYKNQSHSSSVRLKLIRFKDFYTLQDTNDQLLTKYIYMVLVK